MMLLLRRLFCRHRWEFADPHYTGIAGVCIKCRKRHWFYTEEWVKTLRFQDIEVKLEQAEKGIHR